MLSRQYGIWLAFAFERNWNFPASIVSLSNVISRRAKFEMLWIATRRVVALMENIKRKIKIAVSEPVRKAVGFPVFILMSELSILTIGLARVPRPTLIGCTSCYLAPKPFFNFRSALKSAHPLGNSRLPCQFFCDKLFNIHVSLPACATNAAGIFIVTRLS